MNHVRRRVLLSLAGVGILIAGSATTLIASGGKSHQPTDAPPAPARTPAASTVSLTIDYKDGAQKVLGTLPYAAEMTVLDVLNVAAKHPHGITFVSSGSGETAFVKQIDDLKNQGGGTTARNWQFLVNGKVGSRGVGATRLKAGDAVIWEFDTIKIPAAEPK